MFRDYDRLTIEMERDMTLSRLFHYILDNQIKFPKDYTYIILGKIGPTGKTWLCKALTDKGFKAFDISEDIFDLADYQDENNHCVINHFQKHVVVVLNQRLNTRKE